VPDVTDGEELREVARSVAAHTASTAHVAAGSAEVVGLLGDPADEVIALAEERHADVIVVGTHERGWLSRLLTTSVADEVRSRSSIPVLVVPAE
jgi:nucleotide-binding universal stress UspA family protein